MAEQRQTWDEENAATERAAGLYPEPPKQIAIVSSGGRKVCPRDWDLFRENVSPMRGPLSKLRPIWESYVTRLDEIDRQAGLVAAIARTKAIDDRVSLIVDEIETTPAHTLQGLLIKLRVAWHYCQIECYGEPEEWNRDDRLFWSAVQDAERQIRKT